MILDVEILPELPSFSTRCATSTLSVVSTCHGVPLWAAAVVNSAVADVVCFVASPSNTAFDVINPVSPFVPPAVSSGVFTFNCRVPRPEKLRLLPAVKMGALPLSAFVMVVAKTASSPRAAASSFKVSRCPGAASTRLLMACLTPPAVTNDVLVSAVVATVECVTTALSKKPSSLDNSVPLILECGCSTPPASLMIILSAVNPEVSSPGFANLRSSSRISDNTS